MPIRPVVVVPFRILFIVPIDLFNHLLCLKLFNFVQIELWVLSSNPWVYLIVSKLIEIIVITSRYQHGYPWPFLAIPPYRALLPAGLQGYIPYRHRAVVCRFWLVVLLLLVHVKGSIGVHHLWAHPYFSSSVPRVWFV